MKQLTKVPALRVIFFTMQTAKFFIKIQIIFIICIIKHIYKYWKQFIIFYMYIKVNNEKKNTHFEKNIETYQNNIIVNEINKDIKEIFFDWIFDKISAFGSFSEKIGIFITSNLMTFIVFYSTYLFLKEKNPKIVINNFNKYTKNECKEFIYFFLEQEFNDSFFFKQSEEEKNAQVELVIEIFDQMKKSDKIAEKVGVNYFFWGEEYISSTLKWNLFWQKINVFKKKISFSENSKQQAIWIVKNMLDYSRKYPFSKYSKYVCYSVDFLNFFNKKKINKIIFL
jgi:hypothetical protein